jgi:isopenicillin N synthase-like dioxygenase
MTAPSPQERLFQVPIIDVAPYISDPTTVDAMKVVAQVREACMTTGLFEMVGHGITRSLQNQVLKGAATFFALAPEEKMKMDRKLLGGISNRGYDVMGTEGPQAGERADQKEVSSSPHGLKKIQLTLLQGFSISQHFPADHPSVKKHPTLLGPNIWPPSSLLPPSIFKEPMEKYFNAMTDLSSLLLKVLAAGLPYGPHVFDEFLTNGPVAALRLLHYPPTKSGVLGAAAHTDFGAFTLLLQDSHSGLQVQNPATKEWVAVPPREGAYVVNIGDVMERWMKGFYRSNVHRVINSGMEDRYSVPFFFDGNPTCKLTPFDGSEPDGPVLTVEEHMNKRIASTYM